MPQEMNILVVEDNDLDVELLRRGLKKIGATGALVRAKDGVHALEILTDDIETQHLPHPLVILLDINMPRMNGHEFLKSLREIANLRHMQVIVFTTSDSPNDVMQAHQHCASGYVVKPNSSTELRDTLEAMRSYWHICEHPVGPAPPQPIAGS